jgi:hypothetical protein
MHIDPCKEALNFGTYLHVLHTLDGGGICGKHLGIGSAHCDNGKLVVAKVHTTFAASATSYQSRDSHYKH